MGAVAFLVSVLIGARRVSLPAGRAAAAAGALNVLLRWDAPDVFGLTAMVTGVVVVLIVVTGLARRGRATRRVVRRALIVTAVAIGVAVVGAGIAVAQAYGDLRDGEAALRARCCGVA